MTDPVKPVATVPGAATPTEQTPAPITPAEGAAPEKQQEQPKYVTTEDLARHDEELLRRVKQSDRDRNKRIEGELKALRETLQGAGMQPTAEQEAKLRENVEKKYEEPAETEAPASPSPSQLSDDLPPAVARAYGIMQKRGTTIDDADPEFSKHIAPLLKQGPTVDEDDLALATETAIAEKKARIASAKEKAPIRSPGGSGNSTPGDGLLGSSNDYANKLAQERRK